MYVSLRTIFILGETDWKIIVIDVNDPLADQMNGNYYITIHIS